MEEKVMEAPLVIAPAFAPPVMGTTPMIMDMAICQVQRVELPTCLLQGPPAVVVEANIQAGRVRVLSCVLFIVVSLPSC